MENSESDKRTYGFVREPSGDLYQSLLKAALERTQILGLIHHSLHSGGFQQPVEAFTPFLVDEVEVSEWPGTELTTSTALLRTYRLESALVKAMTSVADSLFDWEAPSLPEDVHFLRKDGSPWLASTAHERDAWFELSSSDLHWMQERYPMLADSVADESDQRSFIGRLWKQHLATTFPEELAEEEIRDGVRLGYLDSTVAGCISTFVSGSGQLDHARLEILRTCWADLEEAAEVFDSPGKHYFHRLSRMVDSILAFHHVDPFVTPGRGPLDDD